MILRLVPLATLLLMPLLAFLDAVVPVLRVIDGDTIEVEFDGAVESVRYIGINTLERDDPREEIRALARAASAANARLVEGRRVRLEFDVERRDRYQRLLAYVWVGDTLINELLVRQGHAQPATYPPNVRYVDRFVAAARLARTGTDVANPAPELPTDAIMAVEALEHIGEQAIVCGYVASTRYLTRGQRLTFLNLERAYPNQAFTIVIRDENRSKFESRPEELYRDAEICVEGMIELYRGKPQLFADGPEDISRR